MKLLCDYSFEDLAKELRQLDAPEFVANQIVDWVYGKYADDWSSMSNLSASKREQFSQKWLFPSLQLMNVREDEGIVKFQWKLHDNKVLEGTLEIKGSERTVSLFVQAGAAKRYLSPGEIIEQILSIQKWLKQRDESITQVVFKGEALKNYECVVKAIHILVHPKLLNFSQKRITVHTGSVEGIKNLTGEGLKVNLSVGLHAPNQSIRKKIVSSAKKNVLEDLIEASEEYAKATKSAVTYEYALVRGMNDHPDHAFQLANALKRRLGNVHIIPYAPPIDKKRLKDFRTVLFGGGIKNTMDSA